MSATIPKWEAKANAAIKVFGLEGRDVARTLLIHWMVERGALDVMGWIWAMAPYNRAPQNFRSAHDSLAAFAVVVQRHGAALRFAELWRPDDAKVLREVLKRRGVSL